MSYLYNLFQGSLDDVERRLADVDRHEERVNALEQAVSSDWRLVDPFIADLDWHLQDDLLMQASHLAPRVGQLATELFTAPPLGIEPFDFGYQGALRAAEVHELRNLLEGSDDVVRQADEVTVDRSLVDSGTHDLGILLRGLRPVDDARDVVLLLA